MDSGPFCFLFHLFLLPGKYRREQRIRGRGIQVLRLHGGHTIRESLIGLIQRHRNQQILVGLLHLFHGCQDACHKRIHLRLVQLRKGLSVQIKGTKLMNVTKVNASINQK